MAADAQIMDGVNRWPGKCTNFEARGMRSRREGGEFGTPGYGVVNDGKTLDKYEQVT